MSVLGANPLMMKPTAAAADVVTKSLRFNAGDTPYLSRTPSAGNRTTWTFSTWVKRAGFGTSQIVFACRYAGSRFYLEFTSGSNIEVSQYPPFTLRLVTNAKYRDVGSWYHIVFKYDSTPSSPSSSSVSLYVNGEQVTSFSTATYPSQNVTTSINAAALHVIGEKAGDGGGYHYDGYLADIHFIDGTALTPTSFAEEDATTGQWKPKAYSGSYGDNGFHLDFNDSSDIGNDVSGEGNDFTVGNLAASDVVEDTPTNNYCVWNAVDKGGVVTLSEGNTQFSGPSSSSGWRSVRGTIGVTTGKYYFECYGTWGARGNFGVDVNQRVDVDGYNTAVNGVLFGLWDGYIYTNGVANTGHTSATSGTHTIGIAFDADSGKVWFRVDGGTWENSGGDPANASSSGSATFTAGSLIQPLGACYGGYWTLTSNSSDWEDAAPTGFKALSTANLPTPTIAKGGDYFNTKLYSGSGGTQSITTGLEPDLLWIKNRANAGDMYHELYDDVRGLAEGALNSNDSGVGDGVARIASLDSTGFTTASTSYAFTNATGNTYVAWSWKKSTTAGFGIATYTGTGEMDGDEISVAHGCGGTPEFVIVKDRDGNYGTGFDWIVWHHKLSPDNFLLLNENSSQSAWDLSYPLIQAGATNNTFGIDTTTSGYSLNDGSNSMNGETDYVVYSARSVAGFSQFGDYTGNGSADGPFVWCGFRPAFVMAKRKNSTGDWMIFDGQREGYNVDNDRLVANSSTTENTTDYLDILSNGFKLRSTDSNVNASSGSYVFASFAEAPFKYANAR